MNAIVPHRTSIAAVLSVVFGLLAWFAMPFLGGLVAVICGHAARSEIRRGSGMVDGDGLAISGLVLGWLNLALFGVIALLVFLAIAFGLGAIGLHGWLAHFQLHTCSHQMLI
jgi:hypothetical protein